MRNQNEQKTNYKNQSEWKMLLSIKQIIFDLDEENIIDSANLIIKHIVNSNLISFNMVIIQIIYQAFVKNLNNFDLYIKFMKEIETFEENNKPKIFDVFICYLINKHTQESYCLINYLIEHNFYDSKIVQNLKTPYFMHYMSQERILFLKNNGFLDQIKDIEELSKNDWELHKQFVKEGVNPNEIAKIIRKDDIEKLQEISSQENFNFNQEIEPSLYERCDYINLAYKNVSLINYAAFFSAVKCFKYLLINNVNVNNTGKYAVAGGNLEIIHLCQQNHSSFEGAYEAAIKFHRNDIFKYIYENKFDICGNLNRLGKKCISYHNYEIFIFLIEEGMKINDSTITEAAKIGNIFLVKSFLKENQFPKSILIFASESGNIELIKYILDQKIININGKYVYLSKLEYT